jgi:hypothetical protein
VKQGEARRNAKGSEIQYGPAQENQRKPRKGKENKTISTTVQSDYLKEMSNVKCHRFKERLEMIGL